jgi:D-amino-acid dehydrogenase
MNESRQVVVIGGGVIGASCAYYLSQAGWNVTVIDRGEFGNGCSHGNCGFVCPSHVLPLAAPGAIWPALRSMFKRHSPFSIKPRFDLALWQWLLNFARRCNRRDMLAAGHGIQALLKSSRQLYDELMRKEPFDCEWEARGLLFVFMTQAAMDHYAETDELLRTEFGMPAERWDGERLLKLEPALKPGLAGGWLYRSDAHLRPDKLMASWRRILEMCRVTLVENCQVEGFERRNGQARAIRTPVGEMSASAFVFATGAWTPLLQRELGCSIPIQPGKGYSLTMPRPSRCPTIPLIFEEHRVAITPMASGYRIGSTMEFAGYDTSLNPDRLALLREAARIYLHEPECEPTLEQWYGWRPMTYDGLPIIDRSPAMANVWLAAGHGMLGVSMAPATGKLIAECLSGMEPHIDPGVYSLAR